MTQEEHLICEIEEFKLELEQSKVRMRHLERFIKEKETQLYYVQTKSSKDSLFRRLDIDGYMTDNCNRICDIVKSWLPREIEGDSEYTDAWNDYRNECMKNLK
jgi:hypothetical protein